MSKYDDVIKRYTEKGVSADTVEYAITSVKEGAKREHILESLTASYRGMQPVEANMLLEELFLMSGGEFKKENRTGYLYGALFLLLGGLCAAYIAYTFISGATWHKPVLSSIGAVTGLLAGLGLIIQSLRGKYRDSDDPFVD
jgi:hypothetical protein